MANFILNVNYQTLSRYFEFPEQPDTMSKVYRDGYPLEVDYYYEEEDVQRVTELFRNITSKHNLSEHTDNLLFIVLNQLINRDIVIEASMGSHALSLRHKELAIILLAAIDNREKHKTMISVKTGSDNYKIRDRVLTDWICDLVLSTAKEGKLKLSQFGAPRYLFSPIGQINPEELRKAAETKIQAVETFRVKLIKDLNAQFCFAIFPYLNNETNLTTEGKHNFNDSQLRFLYDLMIGLKLIGDRNYIRSADYEPKDYLRSTLITYAKGFLIKGKKSKIKS